MRSATDSSESSSEDEMKSLAGDYKIMEGIVDHKTALRI